MEDHARPPAAGPCLPLRQWRWIFLCSEAALVGLVIASMYGWRHGGRTIDEFYHPLRGGLVKSILYSAILFQFLVAPFLFRQLGRLAVVAWISALGAFVWINLPVF